MRDGTNLAACVWRPVIETPVPALLVRTPYGKSDVSQYGGTAPNIYVLVEAGYAVVLQDCRGTFGSEGIFVPHESEQQDGVDSIEWLCGSALVRWERRHVRALVPGLRTVAGGSGRSAGA